MIDSLVDMLQPPPYAYERPAMTPDDEVLYNTKASAAAKSYFSTADAIPPAVLLQQAASCRLTWNFLKSKEEKRVAAREHVCKGMVDRGIVMDFSRFTSSSLPNSPTSLNLS